jgi:hypothetical protein
MYLRGFLVLAVGAGIADVRIGQRNDLPALGRVGQDFLVSRHCGIENHFAYRFSIFADRRTVKDGSVLERQ